MSSGAKLALRLFPGHRRATVKITKLSSGRTSIFAQANNLLNLAFQCVLTIGSTFADLDHNIPRGSCTRMTTAAPSPKPAFLPGIHMGLQYPMDASDWGPIQTPSRILPGPQPARSMASFGIHTQRTFTCIRCNCPPHCAQI